MSEEAFNRIAPLVNTNTVKRIAVISVTTSSQESDLTALIPNINSGHYYSFRAVGGTVYLFFNNQSGGTVNEATTGSGVTAAYAIPDGGEEDWEIPDGYTWLVYKGSAACTLRIARSSKNDNDQASNGTL